MTIAAVVFVVVVVVVGGGDVSWSNPGASLLLVQNVVLPS